MRVGVIGVGWGSLVLAPAFDIASGYEVVTLCSRRIDRVRAAGERLGIEDISTDWRETTARDDLDLIAICTPTALHYEQTMAALAAGKHVLCEKPLTLDPAEATEMADLADRTGLVNGVNFEGRWLPERLPVWEMVRDNYVGTPYLARVTTTAEYWHPTRDLQSEWMYDRDRGGGYLLGMASHDVDFLIGLFGEPVAICADVHTSVPHRTRGDGTTLTVTADDTSTVLMRMRSGARCVISTTTVALHCDKRTLEVYGSDGSIMVEGLVQGAREDSRIRGIRIDTDGEVDIAPGAREPSGDKPVPRRRAGGAIRALALMLEDWLPAFEGRPTPVPTLRQGASVARVIDAARRSSAGAGWVTL